MGYDDLDPRRTALLFFDLLNGYYRGADEATQRRMEPVVANAVRLMEAARSASIPICYASANHRPDQATTALLITDTDMRLHPWPDPQRNRTRPGIVGGSWQAEVIDEIRPQPGDYIVPKYRWSAFHQTYLELALRTRGVDTIVIAGGSTDVGIASTAFAARDLDFHQVIVSDACVSPHEDNHTQLMERIFPRMARVRTTEQVVVMMAAGA